MKERYVLLDSIRGITLLSMILYHGMFDLVDLWTAYSMVCGATGICLAAEYLLDFYSAIRLLLESWKKASETGACDFSVGSSDHWGDVCVYAIGKDSVWNPDFYRNGYAASDPAVQSVGTDSGLGGSRRKLPAFWTDKKCEQRNLGI